MSILLVTYKICMCTGKVGKQVYYILLRKIPSGAHAKFVNADKNLCNKMLYICLPTLPVCMQILYVRNKMDIVFICKFFGKWCVISRKKFQKNAYKNSNSIFLQQKSCEIYPQKVYKE